ncbi:MAG: translation initiation factor [Synergistaceae bacterium]|nr:translation initiation factor [Synergistaceae bacterium]
MSQGRAKRITGSGDISLDSKETLSLPIGGIMGSDVSSTMRDQANETSDKSRRGHSSLGAADFLKIAAQVTLHREAAGRGGRTVTIVSFKPAPDGKLADEIARVMRRGLGCGSHVEESKIVLQGDMRERAGGWLSKQGVKRVVMGN